MKRMGLLVLVLALAANHISPTIADQATRAPGVLHEIAPADSRPASAPASSNAHAVLLAAASSPAAVAASSVITLTASGFAPPVLTAPFGTDVVWINTTAMTHTLVSGEPFRLFLPLVLRAGGAQQAPRALSLTNDTPQPASGSGLFTAILPPGGAFTHTFLISGAVPYFLADAPQFNGRVIVQSALPPDPAEVAPPLNLTQITSFLDATSFLYTGDNPIQTGVVSGTIELRRAAVLRGRVLHRDGTALPGVTVSILDHPEFGQTLSRADGMFDLAVNGGGLLMLNYDMIGYLPAQRQVEAPWRDYAWLPDVVLIQQDPNVTHIDLSAGDPMQVARGSVISDTRGMRQATLLFPQGTQAAMVLSNGMTQTLTTLSVRATEYTVGDSGPNAMPAELPANSGYTYAAEFSVDEALAAGATEVRFDRPVIAYLENFIGFPTGVLVPAGYYDRRLGQWVGMPDGRVIKVLSNGGGQASLDIDGDDIADPAPALAELGITSAELQRLAALYQPGQSLWRVPITHFTPCDWNWPYGPPADADYPPVPAPLHDQDHRPSNDGPGEDDECIEIGSSIGCLSQMLGEAVDITGTPFRMHYQSDRVPGRKGANTLAIPVTGASVPASLLNIRLNAFVAGKMVSWDLPPQPNQTFSFEWDGRDEYGRAVQGLQPVVTRLDYTYNWEYSSTPAEAIASLARSPAFARNAGEVPGVGVYGRTAVPGKPLLLSAAWHGSMRLADDVGSGGWDARGQGLGGWTLNVHHVYDPDTGMLYYGDGGQRSAQSLNMVIKTRAGAPEGGAPCAGIPATQVALSAPAAVAVAPDGGYYIAESDGHRICRVGPDGMATTIAGTGAPGFSGDGGPAALAQLNAPYGIAIAPDGSLYIADTGNNRVRRVTPDGIISTVAGTGDWGDGGDGGLAIRAQLTPNGVAVGPDGHLYIAGNDRVRRVAPDGYITTMAGTGVGGYSGDGGLSTQAQLNGPARVAVDGNGIVYIADTQNHRIRRVTPSGIITTVAGSGVSGFAGDGGPAALAQLNGPSGIAIGPDGSLYIADTDNRRVRRVQPNGAITTIAGTGICCSGGDEGPAPLARLGTILGLAISPEGSLYLADAYKDVIRQVALPIPDLGEDLVIPSPNGIQLFQFDANGRHLRTLNALTGGVLYQFVYDAAGRLIEVYDGDGNVTTIVRDANGNPTHIVGPYGHSTALALDANGFLASITRPVGEVTQFAYTADGLLTRMTDPMGGVYQFAYDALGRLIRDEDPAGGVKTLALVESARGYTVTLTSPMSRTTTYGVEYLDTGAVRRVNSDSNGARTEVLIGADGSQTAIYPDGTSMALQYGPDPRFGMQSPLVQQMTISTPDGHMRTTNAARTVTLSNQNDPLSLIEQTDYVTVNGRTFVRTYVAAGRTVTSLTAEGRQTVSTLDAQGRVLTYLPAPSQAPITLTYDGRGRLTQSAQGGQSWLYAYDAFGRVATRTDAAGRRVLYTYDANDRLTALTLPSGATYRFAYDASDNRTQVGMPSGATHALSYTAVDLDSAYAPPGNAAYTRGYDAGRALTRITLPGGRTVDFAYDGAGQLAGMSYPEATTLFEYLPGDLTDRVSQITRTPAGGLAQGIAFAYAAERLAGMTWSGAAQGQFTYTYDDNLFLTAVNFASGSDAAVTALARDGDGLLTGYGPFTIIRNGPGGAPSALGDGVLAVSQSYDALGRVVTRTHTVNGQPLYQVRLSYDNAGRIVGQVETVTSTVTSHGYSYDADGQLTNAQRNSMVVEQYGYDLNGNRSSRQLGGNPSQTATYDAQDRLLQQGSIVYQFDDDGFLAQRGGDTFQYSARGELLSAALAASQTITYSYDALGRRVGRTGSTGSHQYLYGDPGDPWRVTTVRDPSGSLSTLYYDEAGFLFALQRAGARYYVATDQVGTPRVVSNAAGQVIKVTEYDSFGRLISDSNPGFDVPIGFAGGLADPTTGLVRFGYRDYDPETGRWTARDPVLFAGGQGNLYVYVGNNPVGRRDPSGLFCIGASLYAGIGGGVQTCIDGSGVSVCGEVGFGIGADAGIDTGGTAESGTEFGGELKAKCGPVGAGVGFSLDSTGCLKAGPKVELGPLTLEGDKMGLQPEIEGGPEVNLSTKCSAQGKLYGKVCKKVKY